MKKIGKTEKKDVVERKFWRQTSFRVWTVIAAWIAITAPIVIVALIAKMVPLIFPLRISWLTAEILLFLGFLGLWIWPKKYLKQILLAGIVIGALIAIKKPLIVFSGTLWLSATSWVVAEGVVLLGLGIWLKKCLKQVGTIEVPCQGVLTRFSRPIDAVGPGLYFQFFPFERYKEFPTGEFVLTYVLEEGLYSKEEGNLAVQPLKTKIGVYLSFPIVNEIYFFRPRKGRTGKISWGKTSGRELFIKHIYLRLQIKNLLAPDTTENLGKFFEKGVLGGLKDELSRRTSKDCREKNPAIEEGIKFYLLAEQGNPFYDCGIPKECLDIELIQTKLPEDTEKAYRQPEIARKDAEAAKHERTATGRRLAAYTEKGVSSDIAAFAVGGVQGKGMTTEQIRDLVILHAFKEGAMSFRGSSPSQKKAET